MVFSNMFDEGQRRTRRKQQEIGTVDLESKVDLQQGSRETNSNARKKRKRNATSKGNDNPSDSNHSAVQSQKNQRNSNQRNAGNIHFQHRRPSFQPLSQEVVEFSNHLKDLSRQKNLEALLELYYDNQYDAIRDEHHACIVIDSCAKCGGNIQAAEQVVAQLCRKNSGNNLLMQNVETQTALLKVYVYAGNMGKAWRLFQKIKYPNVRTLNTLLRGCLWSAAEVLECNDVSGCNEVIGGVITSEKAWKHYAEKFSAVSSSDIPPNRRVAVVQNFDVSSYEYAITLLCQALRFREAEARIQEFCTVFGVHFKGTAKITCDKPDQMAVETLAVCYLSLSRSFALLRSDALWASCQRCLSAIKLSRTLLQDLSQPSISLKRSKSASGGKRGWKKSSSPEETHGREASNISYREHRLSEFESEVRSLLKHSHRKSTDEADSALDAGKFTEIVISQLKDRLLYFSGGSITPLCSVTGGLSEDVPKPVINASRNQVSSKLAPRHFVASLYSFGLLQLAWKKLNLDEAHFNNDDVALNDLESLGGLFDIHSAGLVGEDCIINFDQVFADSTLPLDVEIGAGFGSWIVQQAKENCGKRNYVAVELRADRCYQIFARALLDYKLPLNNLCVVGSDCCALLRERIKPYSVSNFFANHPEPPTQIIGNNPNYLRQLVQGRTPEPVHMLTSATIISMSKCLKERGQIVLISDNRSYTQLLAATFCKVVRGNKGILESVRPDVRCKDNVSGISLESLQHMESYQSTVDIYIYKSNMEGGASYYDRLWRTGAGSHSEKHSRFVILMQRC
jgi:Putative methyltransferase